MSQRKTKRQRMEEKETSWQQDLVDYVLRNDGESNITISPYNFITMQTIHNMAKDGVMKLNLVIDMMEKVLGAFNGGSPLVTDYGMISNLDKNMNIDLTKQMGIFFSNFKNYDENLRKTLKHLLGLRRSCYNILHTIKYRKEPGYNVYDEDEDEDEDEDRDDDQEDDDEESSHPNYSKESIKVSANLDGSLPRKCYSLPHETVEANTKQWSDIIKTIKQGLIDCDTIYQPIYHILMDTPFNLEFTFRVDESQIWRGTCNLENIRKLWETKVMTTVEFLRMDFRMEKRLNMITSLIQGPYGLEVLEKSNDNLLALFNGSLPLPPEGIPCRMNREMERMIQTLYDQGSGKAPWTELEDVMFAGS